MKRLIIHADDLGMYYSINNAIFDCFKYEVITSASIMVPCSWFPQVVEWAKEHPQYDLGIHLTFTSEWKNYRWRPLVNCLSLVDSDGYFFATEKEFAEKANVREVGLEAMVQIEAVLKAGIKPTHIDSHMFTVYSRPDIRDECERIAGNYNLKFKQIPTVIAGQPPQSEWDKHYWDLISNLPEGISQLIVHPGYQNSELEAISEGVVQGNAESRRRDVQVLQSSEFQRKLEEYGIELATWKDA